MDERVSAAAVWREALAIIYQHSMATVAPVLFLGALTETPYLYQTPNLFSRTLWHS
jgi:hypothetical protein